MKGEVLDGYEVFNLGREKFLENKTKIADSVNEKVIEGKEIIQDNSITDKAKLALGVGAAGAALATAGYVGHKKGFLKVPSFLSFGNKEGESDSKSNDSEDYKTEALVCCEKIRKIIKLSETEFLELIECFEKADFRSYKEMINAYRDIKKYKDEIGKSNYQEIGYFPIR